MFSRDKILKETSPLGIFFVKSGSDGNKLLFRYPYDESFYEDADLLGSPYDDITEQDRLQIRNVISESDEALCNIFSVNPNLCGQKLEIKINNVRHVCHPMSLLPNQTSISGQKSLSSMPITSTLTTTRSQRHLLDGKRSTSSEDQTLPNQNHQSGDITSFNIVCSLRASASYDIVDCYYDLSKRLAIALSSDERRCSYLSKEVKAILSTWDEREMAYATHDESMSRPLSKISSRNKICSNSSNNQASGDTRQSKSPQKLESVFAQVLNNSSLARDLKEIFINLSVSGIVDLKINNWINVSFCLPQKVHRLRLMTHKSMPAIGTADIKRCLMYLRPYHGLLLLYEPQELLDSLPIDASPAFIQLIKVTKPDKNFMDLAVDANLTLMQIFCIVSQLIYWAKATVIYPICDSNVYAIHPLASIGLQSQLVCEFRARFPSSKSLHHYLADFSEAISLSQLNGPLLNIDEKVNLLNIVAWLLQRRILIQIHKYIFLIVDKDNLPSQVSSPTIAASGNNAIAFQVDGTTTGSTKLNDRAQDITLVERYANSDGSSQQKAQILSLQRAGLSLTGARSVLKVPSSNNPDDLKLFINLMPHFDGKHHIEDIMFFENLERSQVLILCDKFREILYTCHYEDAAVCQLSPFNGSA